MKFNTVPITLVTGYLGSGKTTLINNILSNKKGLKFAVIVNDIGEVNIDAELIEKGGVVSSQDNNLVALQNGCICCTLKKDLINRLADLVNSGKFDHILIEASGICEPIPIAQTICYMQDEFKRKRLPEFYKLDAIVSVVDALRLRDEFGCGEVFKETKRGGEDIENLVIQQIEFCDVIILNKISEISSKELARVRKMIKTIQPNAKIIETDYCNLELSEIVDTNLFSYEKAITSSGWMEEFEDRGNEHDADHDDDHDEDHDHEEHEHHHHHHEHGVTENDDESSSEEYDIGTYVYFRKRPFDNNKFAKWSETDYGRMIIRSKGIVYFSNEMNMAYIYEQAGKQKSLSKYGEWYSTGLTKQEIEDALRNDENFRKDWDETYGDRMIKLVFIGQDIDKEKIKKDLDNI